MVRWESEGSTGGGPWGVGALGTDDGGVGVGATVGEVLPVGWAWEIPPPAARPKGDAAGA